MANANFNNLLTTTLDKHRPQFVDAIFKARPLTYFLTKAGQIRMESGGSKIIEPLIYAENGTVSSYSGSDTIAITDTEVATASEWSWKQIAGSVVITGIDEAKNSGPEAIINLLDTKVQVAKESIISALNVMFFANGTGNSSKDWEGLANLVDATTGTLGGINIATDAYWQTGYTDATIEALGLSKMRTAFNTVSKGNDTPGFVLTTQTLFEKYESLLQPSMQYESKEVGDGGFQSLVFKGRPVVFDEDCPTGKVYFINPKYLRVVGHTNNWFRTTPFKQPENQDIRVAQIIAYGNFVANNRRMQGVLTAKTA